METKIIIREFNIYNYEKELEELEKTLNKLKEQKWIIKNSNLINNKIKYTLYFLLER